MLHPGQTLLQPASNFFFSISAPLLQARAPAARFFKDLRAEIGSSLYDYHILNFPIAKSARLIHFESLHQDAGLYPSEQDSWK